MRHTLLALSLALLPLAAAQASDHDHGEHDSLGAHEHGVASLNVALDGNSLEIQLESPAMNLIGFEHAPGDAADHVRIAAARTLLEQPQLLFGLPIAATCRPLETQLESPLFATSAHAETGHGHDHEDEHEQGHSDVDASYRLRCEQPQALQTLDLGPLFERFPAIHKVTVQLIGHSGQQGAELTPAQARLSF